LKAKASRLTAWGISNQAVAEALVISERMVANHVANRVDKLHLAN